MDHLLTIGECARIACVLEASARKFGNVHRFQDFQNLTYRDLVNSAVAIGPILEHSSSPSVGETVFRCIQATRQVVDTNTNLGIVLLLAPLAAVSSPLSRLCGRGAGGEGHFTAPPEEALTPDPSPAKPGEGDPFNNHDSFWQRLQNVVAATTVEDAELVYRAIRLARPGGMDHVEDQDVENKPTKTLREVMALAANRDLIARQYAKGFVDVKGGVEFLQSDLSRYSIPGIEEEWERRIINLQMWFLARDIDSLIYRKRGEAHARQLQIMAQVWYDAPIDQRARLQSELEVWFAAEFPHRNPGTTADLVCASLFVALRMGIIPLPEIPEEYLKES